jgi:NADH-quinone oxidoreductase subunit J
VGDGPSQLNFDWGWDAAKGHGMQTFTFALLALVSLFSAIMVITRKNPIYSILYLVLAFFCYAGFYVLLGASFLAAIQILVYAGAIMVLFLFVIMMLNLRDPEKLEGKRTIWQTLGAIVGAGFGLVLLAYLSSNPGIGVPSVPMTQEAYAMGSTSFVGKALFTDYVLAFEIAGVLLLAAVIGAVALAKKNRV